VIAQEHFPELDISKVMKLALVHDIPEAFTGDQTPSDNVTPKQKEFRENKAFRQLFSGFKDADEYQELWKEYSKQSSAEAKFVLQIDKLEMVMQASIYEKTTKHDLQEFYDSVLSVITDPKLKKILHDITSERISSE
ncbi:MAG: HD domain-containing protein, partial [Candidatus Woesearchaeota archaeon]